MSHLLNNALYGVVNRSERYTHKELRFLLSEVQRYPYIIESPSSHSETKSRKILLWQHISRKLRGEFPSSNPKSALQLRNWWKRTKSRAKQRLSYGKLTTGKYSNNKISRCNSRGYLEGIYSEICEFRRHILSEYTMEKEDAEFANFLEETSEGCATYDEEIFCGSLRNDDLEDGVKSDNMGAKIETSAVINDFSRGEISQRSNEPQDVSTNKNYENTNVSSDSICSCGDGGMLMNSQDLGESTSQDCNNGLLFNQIISNALLFLTNCKYLPQNSDSFNPTQSCTSENNWLERECLGDINANHTKDKKHCGEMCSMPFVPDSSSSSSSSSIIKPKLGNTNSHPENSKLLMELMQIDNEILRLKRRKLDLQLTISEEYINNYMKTQIVPRSPNEFVKK